MAKQILLKVVLLEGTLSQNFPVYNLNRNVENHWWKIDFLSHRRYSSDLQSLLIFLMLIPGVNVKS